MNIDHSRPHVLHTMYDKHGNNPYQVVLYTDFKYFMYTTHEMFGDFVSQASFWTRKQVQRHIDHLAEALPGQHKILHVIFEDRDITDEFTITANNKGESSS